MKTISVSEAAQALGISAKRVLYRRAKGRLQGTFVKNDRGIDEIRIYPTREIIEGLKKINSPVASAIDELDIVDDQVLGEIENFDSTFGVDDIVETELSPLGSDWTGTNRAAGSGVSDELWNSIIFRFVMKLEEKDQLIGEMRFELQDKERQLKLLPDFQKEADERIKATEKKAQESIEALKAENEKLKLEAEEASLNAAKLQLLEKQIEQLRQPKPSFWKRLFMQ